MSKLRFKVHAIVQMEERGLGVEDVRMALENGQDIESRPDETPYPARLVLGISKAGMLHIAVRDNIDEDEIIIETVYRPNPELWEPGFMTRRKKR